MDYMYCDARLSKTIIGGKTAVDLILAISNRSEDAKAENLQPHAKRIKLDEVQTPPAETELCALADNGVRHHLGSFALKYL